MHLEEITILFSTAGIAVSLLIMMDEPLLGLALILANIITMFIIIHSIHKDGKK